jgi:hypothetical protein
VAKIDHRVGKCLECVVHVTDVFEAQQQTAELVFPGEDAFDGPEAGSGANSEDESVKVLSPRSHHPTMSKLKSMDALFSGRHFNRDVIILCVRWYLRYKLSLRDLVEMMAERGLSLAHTTILRWVKRYTPEFIKRWNCFGTPTGRSWCVDETYRTPSQRSPPTWG